MSVLNVNNNLLFFTIMHC